MEHPTEDNEAAYPELSDEERQERYRAIAHWMLHASDEEKAAAHERAVESFVAGERDALQHGDIDDILL